MEQQKRGSLAAGLIFILLGGLFLLEQLVPGLQRWVDVQFTWPLIVIGVGVIFFLVSLLAGVPDLAVPASIIAGIGGLLYWQNETGNWSSWAYAWTLIPGFAGVGTILAGLMVKRTGKALREGLNMIIISLIMFLIFSSFLGGWNIFGAYWPVLLILLGIWLMVRPLWRLRR